MIRTLPVTILIEGIIVLIYGAIRRKPAGTLLAASLFVNVLTQLLLWIVLGIFFRAYFAALLISEVFIWLSESLLMLRLTNSELNLKHAFILSMYMNAASFGVGWFLLI